MGKVLLVMLLGIVLLTLCGCVTSQQQARLNQMTAEQRDRIVTLKAEIIAAYELIEKQTTEIKTKVESGTITLSDGQSYIAMLNAELNNGIKRINQQIDETKRIYSEEKRDILDSGKSKLDYYLGIAVSILASFFGVNAYRSRKHPLTTNIGNG